MIINKGGLLIFIIILIALSSCIKNSEIKEATFVNFGENGLQPNEQFTFYPFEKIKHPNSKDDYSISISIRYLDICELKYLPLKIEYASLENDSIIEKKIIIPLFDNNGIYKGKGNLGLYESETDILSSQPFENGFFVSITSPEVKTQGILSLGVISKRILSHETNSRSF